MKVTDYLPSSNEEINKSASRKDLFYRLRNSGTYGAEIYDSDATISGRNATAEEMMEILPVMKHIKVSFTAAQIKTLATTPRELVPAPGVGYALEPVSCAVFYNYNTAAFNAVSGILEVFTDTGASQHLRTESSIIGGVADTFQRMYHQTGDIATIIENKSLKIRALNDSTLGDGTIDVYLSYNVLILV